MKVHRSDLAHAATLEGAVVVIDVLRSFTTAAFALAGGASEVIAVDTPDRAKQLVEHDPRALTVGARGGGAPVPGFDLGNSPSRLIARDGQPDASLLAGRRVILYTAGGTQGLAACRSDTRLWATSLVCAAATAAHLLAVAPPQVTLMVTGTWTDRDGDEDHACADLLEQLLQGRDPPRGPYVERVRRSDFGRRFGTAEHPELPAGDLDCCALADPFDFAMPVHRTPQGLALVAWRPGLA